MRYLYYSAIPEEDSSRLLMVREGDKLTLPFHETVERHNWQDVVDEHRLLKPESTEGRPWGQPLKKPAGAPLNLG